MELSKKLKNFVEEKILFEKLLLGGILIFCCTFIGIKLSNKERFKRDVYYALTSFSKEIATDVTVFKTTIDKKVECMPQILIDVFGNATSVLKDGGQIKITDKRFTCSELKLIEDFFNSLGNYDSYGQKNVAEYYFEKFNYLYSEKEQSYKKTSVFYTKMGATIGVAIFVIIY